jgi:hypothetical protein
VRIPPHTYPIPLTTTPWRERGTARDLVVGSALFIFFLSRLRLKLNSCGNSHDAALLSGFLVPV